MKNSSLALGAAVLSLIITGGIAATSNAFTPNEAARPNWNQANVQRQDHPQRDQMKQILADGDYDAWAELMAQRPNFDENLINLETFNKLVQAHELFEAGSTEEAKAIMEELGLGQKVGKHFRGKHKGEHREKFQQMKQILENQDYDAWAELMENHPRFEELEINENTFSKFLEAHELMESDDRDAAREIMEELGFGPRK